MKSYTYKCQCNSEKEFKNALARVSYAGGYFLSSYWDMNTHEAFVEFAVCFGQSTEAVLSFLGMQE